MAVLTPYAKPYPEDGPLEYAGLDAGAHDIAAIHCIVTEAGGKATSLDGSPLNYTKPFHGVIMTNGIIHDHIIDLLR